jgi:predicted protein tyrosine phosphatase
LEIRVLSRKAAERALKEDRVTGNIKAMISIADSYPYTERAPYGTARVPCVLRLIFDDTTNETSFYTPPSLEVAKRIVAFADGVKDSDGILLIHCEAGISRSAATAIICKSTWDGPGKEEDSIIYTYLDNPRAWPNTLLIKYGDEALNRQGVLIGAVQKNPDAEIWSEEQKNILNQSEERGSDE